jgi:AraC-like DNA-binding protein/ligand-binding sensor protein
MANRSYRDPGYAREQKVVSLYTRATGSNVQIFDENFRPCEADSESADKMSGIEQSVCLYCTCANRNGGAHCREAHVNAMREAGRNGKPCIYQCELGLLFWVSPIFSEGKFSGALRGSGYISGSVDSSMSLQKCNGAIPAEEFTRRVAALPSGDTEKIQSLAEMLQLCAESLSTGRENYHELLRLRSEQQASLSALIEELKTKYPQGSSIPGYPLDTERQLIAALHRGDKKETEKLLNELLAMLIFSNPDNFRNIQLRALELAILLTRAGINSGSNTAMENNAHYLKQIQEAKAIEEITGTLHGIMENVSGQITSFQGIPHALAMRKAEAYIRENLTRKISLREIAKIAGLSAPYFSTIFKEEMGENLSRYINRLRVEKASKMLIETNVSLSEISSECCFQDQSWFSKIFKSFTGISPGKYRNQGGNLSTMS